MFGFESWVQPVAILVAALAAGVGNTIAGGGTILSFPVLVWTGLTPVQASVTSTVGLWTGSVGGAWSYRSRLGALERRWLWTVVPALVGGTVGAYLLIRLPPSWFALISPFLVVAASCLVAIEPMLRSRLVSWTSGRRGHGTLAPALGVLLISSYGGYFGAGVGFLILVVLAVLGLDDLHQANALKNLLVVGLKGAAVVYFLFMGAIVWPATILMVVASTVGGWFGGYLIREVDPKILRRIIVIVGVIMGALMVAHTYM